MHLSENDIFSKCVIIKFRKLIYVLALEIIIDNVFVFLADRTAAGIEVPITLLYLIKSLELVLNLVVAFLVFEIFYNKKANAHDKLINGLRRIMLTMIALSVFLQLAPLLGGSLFYISSDGMYHRGGLMFVYVSILLLSISVLIYTIIIFSNKTQSIMRNTLISFAVILVGSVLLRAIFPNDNYDYLCLSIAVLFLLMYYSHVTLRVDPLTRLLNRQVYMRLVEKIDYTTIFIMIDANNFKSINDTFGHECGDQTLKQFANVILEAYGKYAYCFRIGGDEFCAILKPEVFDKMVAETEFCDAYSMAEKFMERLDDLIKTRAEAKEGSSSYLKHGVSQGYGIYYADESRPSIEENMPLRNVIELADKRMYLNKEKFRAKHPETVGIREEATERAKVVYEPSTPELIDDKA